MSWEPPGILPMIVTCVYLWSMSIVMTANSTHSPHILLPTFWLLYPLPVQSSTLQRVFSWRRGQNLCSTLQSDTKNRLLATSSRTCGKQFTMTCNDTSMVWWYKVTAESKKFRKSVSISWSYRQEYSSTFLTHNTMANPQFCATTYTGMQCHCIITIISVIYRNTTDTF